MSSLDISAPERMVHLRGHLMMSRKEREWLRVLERVRKKEINLRQAAEIVKGSYRQCLRKYKQYKRDGSKALVHQGRGRPSNRGKDPKTRRVIIERYEQQYGDFGPTLAAEKLAKEGYEIDHETLRRWLIKERLWKRRRRRSRHRSWRERRAHFGELVQMDGSLHKWFEDRAPGCCLMNMVDDATGTTMSLFDEQETTAAAMTLLWKWIDRYGIPAGLYTDRKNVYVPDKKTAAKAELSGDEAFTEFGRACKQLGIRIIEAHSPEAKGRVERSNGTYQDRLVKELRLEQISEINSANKLLHESFIDELNRKFAVFPREEADFHRTAKGLDLKSILCVEEDRTLTDDWVVRYNNRYYQLSRQTARPPTSKKVTVKRYLNGELHFNYRGKDNEYCELPQRPIPAVKTKEPSPKSNRTYVPRSDHPWRSSYKRGS
jgi:transposase